MNSIPLPDTRNEALRLEALKRYNILDTPPERSFDNLVKLAAQLLNVPIATLSLVDADRIWFKSGIGVRTQQIDRKPGLCASAIQSDDIYIVEDAAYDPRALLNPLVTGEFGLRFYAAAPLKISEGYNLGTLCIMDKKPRKMTEAEMQTLKELSLIVTDLLELRLESRKATARENQLLSLIAHELKKSLTAIPAYSELIKSEVSSNTPALQMCNHILKASDRIKDIIKERLEMALLQSEEVWLERNNFDMATIIWHVTAANIALANAKQQKLYIDSCDSIIINADETKVAEIADNLVNNAIKYSPVGATIDIKLTAEKGNAVLEVADEGPGLIESDKEKLFMPFTRLSARPTGGERSTGVGLSIVKLLVDAHGGFVYAKNNPKKSGAIFKVEIPAAI